LPAPEGIRAVLRVAGGLSDVHADVRKRRPGLLVDDVEREDAEAGRCRRTGADAATTEAAPRSAAGAARPGRRGWGAPGAPRGRRQDDVAVGRWEIARMDKRSPDRGTRAPRQRELLARERHTGESQARRRARRTECVAATQRERERGSASADEPLLDVIH